MITWLVGENSFEVHEAVKSIEASFSGVAERIDATELTLSQLPDLLMGISLFSEDRLVILKDISRNAALWEKLPEWLPRVSDTIQLVFIDAKPDKRTAAYKALKAVATIKEFTPWTSRDTAKAEQWVKDRSLQYRLTLSAPVTSHLVRRVGLDQWQLVHALEVLSFMDEVTIEAIDEVIPANPTENIFQLFETALEGKPQKVIDSIRTLELTEDPYALFALLTSQALNLAAIAYARAKDGDDAIKQFAIHPFVASKLARHADKLGERKVASIVELFSKADADMKRSRAEPWLIIEKTLMSI
jgi:DNA polymerase III delta subunit